MSYEKLHNDFNEMLNKLFSLEDDASRIFSNGNLVPIKKPFIIEIEGTDRSGKETQSKAIQSRLESMGFTVGIIHFPRYRSDSTNSIKKYLNGEYGELKEVTDYQASLLYTQDRLDFKLSEFNTYAEAYDILIFDRYVGSNLIHQSVKSSDWEEFTNYQFYFEYFKLGLPQPHVTIFLDMPVDLGKKIAKNRCNKINGKTDQDIHESNDDYMNKCYDMAHKIADKYSWFTVKCYSEFGPFKRVKNINSITNEIMEYLDYPISEYKIFLDNEILGR